MTMSKENYGTPLFKGQRDVTMATNLWVQNSNNCIFVLKNDTVIAYKWVFR